MNSDKNSTRSIAVHNSEKMALDTIDNVAIIRPGVIIGGGDVF